MSVRIPAVLLSAALASSACTVLEYDKMDGTRFPEDYEEDGVTHSLASIWDTASMDLQVDWDDETLAIGTLPSGDLEHGISDPGYISYLQALDMAKAHRESPVGPTTLFWFWEVHHVQGLVLDSYYFDTKTLTKDEFTLGVMPDTTDRSTFVNFFRNPSISSHRKKYLHSAAHELGHAFNLNHYDSAKSIMTNTTDWIWGGLFDFSSTSMDHLETHDRDAVYPGLGPYHDMHSKH